MAKWYDIEGSVQVDGDEEEFNIQFLRWIEDNGWSFAGVIQPTPDGEEE